jgi:hypothetical protein
LFAPLRTPPLATSEPAQNERRDRLARKIRAFVENPITNLVNGALLFLIGLTEASRTFEDDVANRQLRVGHGLILIGLFSALQALPHLLAGLDASGRYLESKDHKAPIEKSDDKP